jgi:alpha-L-rhamnosidase
MSSETTAPFGGRSSWVWTDYAAYGMGSWSAPQNTGESSALVSFFRRTFTAPESAQLTIHVSADSRYILWCNGRRVGRGPAKGDVRHQYYDSYEITDYLTPGKNVLAAQVISFARVRAHPGESGAPNSIMTDAWLFTLEGDLVNGAGRPIERLDTDQQWRSVPDDSTVFCHREGWGTYLGMFENFTGAKYPWGWQNGGFNDQAWQPVQVVHRTCNDEEVSGFDSILPHVLTPRIIPPLEETPRRFEGADKPILIHSGEDSALDSELRAWRDVWQALTSEDRAVTIPANTRAGITLWCDTLQTGFPILKTENGDGSRIRLTYAEALSYQGESDNLAWRVYKGKIDPKHAPDEGMAVGYWDEFEPGGGHETYEPLHWRTFRYIRLEVETGENPLTITKMAYDFTAYPFEELASFVSSDVTHERMWDLSWRTARLCAHETYEDCPYYEQLQYAGDSQVQARISYYVTGDHRLAKQAIRHFDWSRGADGLSQSRYPSRNPQYIPSWSLIWVMMVRDYWWHTGDVAEVQERIPGIAATLDWFARYENDDGLLEAVPGWKVVDWVKGWEPSGYPPGAQYGVSSLINLQYVCALQFAAQVGEAAGDKWRAHNWRRRAKRIAGKISNSYWWPEQGVFRDHLEGDELSELTQAWAILSEMPSRRQSESMVRRLTGERSMQELPLAQATLYGRFYVFRALSEADAYDEAYGLFDHWRTMMATDLTTWPEEPFLARSYCHAWSATPIYELLSEILGAKPAEAGWDRILIRPNLWGLSWADGTVPTPHGDIRIRWDIEGDEFHLTARGPDGVPIEVELPDGSRYEAVGSTGRLSCTVEPRVRSLPAH